MLSFKGIFLNRDFCLLDVIAFLLVQAILGALGPLSLGAVERCVIFFVVWWGLKAVIEFIREKAGVNEKPKA